MPVGCTGQRFWPFEGDARWLALTECLVNRPPAINKIEGVISTGKNKVVLGSAKFGTIIDDLLDDANCVFGNNHRDEGSVFRVVEGQKVVYTQCLVNGISLIFQPFTVDPGLLQCFNPHVHRELCHLWCSAAWPEYEPDDCQPAWFREIMLIPFRLLQKSCYSLQYICKYK